MTISYWLAKEVVRAPLGPGTSCSQRKGYLKTLGIRQSYKISVHIWLGVE
jgi:hypothetical protein